MLEEEVQEYDVSCFIFRIRENKVQVGITPCNTMATEVKQMPEAKG